MLKAIIGNREYSINLILYFHLLSVNYFIYDLLFLVQFVLALSK